MSRDMNRRMSPVRSSDPTVNVIMQHDDDRAGLTPKRHTMLFRAAISRTSVPLGASVWALLTLAQDRQDRQSLESQWRRVAGWP